MTSPAVNSVVGATTATITIRESTLLKGHYYKLVVYANTYKSAVGSTTYAFFTNCLPSAGSCTVSPTSGKIAFVLACCGLSDELLSKLCKIKV